MTQTLFSQVKSFCTTQNGAPAKATSVVLAAIEHTLEHRDWDALAYFMGHAPTNMRTPARRIADACLGGVTFDFKSKEAKAHRCKCMLKLGENFAATDRMNDLRALVAEGEGISGKAVREAFPAPTGPEKSKAEILAAYVKRLKKLEETIAEEDGITWQDVMAEAHPEINF